MPGAKRRVTNTGIYKLSFATKLKIKRVPFSLLSQSSFIPEVKDLIRILS